MNLFIINTFLFVAVVVFSSAYNEKTYKLELVVVVDKFARDKWVDWVGSKQNMIRDLKSNIMAANTYYKKSDLDLELRVKKFVILKGNITIPGEVSNENVIDTSAALNAVSRYLRSSEYSYPYYDAAMYVTGHNLDGAVGVAWKGTACTRDAMSVVELTDGNIDGTIAHELAHILDSAHDSGDCKPEDGYIMSPAGALRSKYRWSFSRCSINDIKNYVQRLSSPYSRNCLVETKQGPFFYNLPGYYLKTPLAICKKHIGGFSWPATYSYEPDQYGDEVCRSFSCFSKFEDNSYYSRDVYAPEGMICGQGRKCFSGVCATVRLRNSTDGSGVTDRCRLGEPMGELPDGDGLCTEMPNFYCQQGFYKNMCCISCQNEKPEIVEDDCRRRLGALGAVFC